MGFTEEERREAAKWADDIQRAFGWGEYATYCRCGHDRNDHLRDTATSPRKECGIWDCKCGQFVER